jgi:hypothetical protein
MQLEYEAQCVTTQHGNKVGTYKYEIIFIRHCPGSVKRNIQELCIQVEGQRKYSVGAIR